MSKVVIFVDRKTELNELFKDIDQNQRKLVDKLIGEVIYIEEMLDQLKKLPFVRVHPKDKSRQEVTPAGKQYKDMTATYMNAIRILCSLLNKAETDDFDPVAEFMKGMEKR